MTRALRFVIAAWIALACSAAQALTSAQEVMLFGAPSWALPGAAVDLNFATGQYYTRGAAGALTNSRASAETCFDASGVLHQAASTQNCVTNLGVSSWESRTNWNTNSVLAGAVVGATRSIAGITGLSRTGSASAVLLCSTCNVAANDLITISGASVSTYNGVWVVSAATANTSITFTTATSATDSATGETVSAQSPGTYPTGWQWQSENGVQGVVVAIGSQNGLNTVDMQIAGVTTQTYEVIVFTAYTAASAVVGQTWSSSFYAQESGGSLTNITNVNSATYTYGGSGLNSTPVSLSSTALSLARSAFTMSNGTTNAFGSVSILATLNAAINITIRFAAPQLELNPNIPATVASAVVATGGTCTPGTYTFTVAGGTGTTATISGTVTGTTLGGTLTVATVGSYSVMPTSPATLNGGTCTVQPTATLTQTDNSANAFATPPILTSGTAATRAADNITLATQPCLNPSVLVSGTPAAPTSYPITQRAAAFNGASNGISIDRGGFAASPLITAGIGGSYYVAQPTGTWARSAAGKMATAYAPDMVRGVFNGGAVASTATTGTMGGLTTLNIGDDKTGANQFNGVISRLAVACGGSLLGD